MWPGGGRLILPCFASWAANTAAAASSLLPAHSRIAWRDRRWAAVWRQLELLTEAPVASRDASTTLPGYLTLLNR
jgi:hypothetical protein